MVELLKGVQNVLYLLLATEFQFDMKHFACVRGTPLFLEAGCFDQDYSGVKFLAVILVFQKDGRFDSEQQRRVQDMRHLACDKVTQLFLEAGCFDQD